jgi:hypothetical protein
MKGEKNSNTNIRGRINRLLFFDTSTTRTAKKTTCTTFFTKPFPSNDRDIKIPKHRVPPSNFRKRVRKVINKAKLRGDQ